MSIIELAVLTAYFVTFVISVLISVSESIEDGIEGRPLGLRVISRRALYTIFPAKGINFLLRYAIGKLAKLLA